MTNATKKPAKVRRERTTPDAPTDQLAEYVSLATIAQRIGKSSKSVSRWVTRGVAVGDQRIHLAALQLGHGYMTRPADVEAFGAAVVAARQAERAAQSANTTIGTNGPNTNRRAS